VTGQCSIFIGEGRNSQPAQARLSLLPFSPMVSEFLAIITKTGPHGNRYCANGQCAQCLVLADGIPVKSCMEMIKPGMKIEPLVGLPELPPVSPELQLDFQPIEEVETTVLIIGGGPAGLAAAIELGSRGVSCLLVDDKHRLGGKLVLQTHRFFGSVEAVYAGTRGIDLATKLERKSDSIHQ